MNDVSHLRKVSSDGNTLVFEGQATGTLPGKVRVSMMIASNVVRSGFTIYLNGGSITGHSVGRLHFGKGEYASFGGSLTISHGSGHYTHASGTGNLYGAINRVEERATVQAIGRLRL